MTPLLASAHFGFAPHAAVFIWLAGVAVTIPALIVAGVACRQRAGRPLFALKSFRVAAILAFLDAAALATILLSWLLDRGAWERVRSQGVDFGFCLFLFAITSVLWGVLLLIRKKLLASPLCRES